MPVKTQLFENDLLVIKTMNDWSLHSGALFLEVFNEIKCETVK